MQTMSLIIAVKLTHHPRTTGTCLQIKTGDTGNSLRRRDNNNYNRRNRYDNRYYRLIKIGFYVKGWSINVLSENSKFREHCVESLNSDIVCVAELHLLKSVTDFI